jgi:hypothetical protein
MEGDYRCVEKERKKERKKEGLHKMRVALLSYHIFLGAI